jgi:hypothetical protein
MVTKKEFEDFIKKELNHFLSNWDTEVNRKMYPNELENMEEWFEQFLLLIRIRND